VIKKEKEIHKPEGKKNNNNNKDEKQKKKTEGLKKYKRKILHSTSVTVLQFPFFSPFFCFLIERVKKKIELDNLKCGHLE